MNCEVNMLEESKVANYQSPKSLIDAKNLLQAALSVDALLYLIAGFNSYTTLTTLQQLQDFNQAAIDAINTSETLLRLTILTTLFVGCALILWLKSCYKFAKTFIGATDFKYEGWTALGWIVPVWWFFRPYQVINEIFKVSSPKHSGRDTWQNEDYSGLLITWWIFYVLIHLIIIGITKIWTAVNSSDPSLSYFIDEFHIYITLSVLSLIISGMWCLIIINLTDRLLKRGKTPQKDGTMNYSDLNSVTPAENTNQAQQNTLENDNFLLALEEYEGDERDKGLWAKCFALSNGDKARTKSMYLKERANNFAATVGNSKSIDNKK